MCRKLQISALREVNAVSLLCALTGRGNLPLTVGVTCLLSWITSRYMLRVLLAACKVEMGVMCSLH